MTLDPGAVAFIFGTPPENPVGFNGLAYALNLDSTGFDPDVDAPKIFDTYGPYTESGMSFMTPPDLTMSGLFKHKSKLLVFHGVADAVFSSQTRSSGMRIFRIPGEAEHRIRHVSSSFPR